MGNPTGSGIPVEKGAMASRVGVFTDATAIARRFDDFAEIFLALAGVLRGL